MTPNELLASGYRMARAMLHKMVDDLTETEFRHQPVPGANCAAWIVGHLAVIARRAADRLGATGLPPLTEEYVARFSATKEPAKSQTDLEEKQQLLALFDLSVEKLIDAIQMIPAEALSNPSASRVPFTTNYGEAILFGSLHTMFHNGQLATIRRSLEKPMVL